MSFGRHIYQQQRLVGVPFSDDSWPVPASDRSLIACVPALATGTDDNTVFYGNYQISSELIWSTFWKNIFSYKVDNSTILSLGP